MTTPALKRLDERFSIHRFHNSAEIPHQVFESSFFNIIKTDDELSIVCPSSLELDSGRLDADWVCFKVSGPLALDLHGIIAGLARVLAEAKISIFAISTFDTDYILVKSMNAEAAIRTLKAAGYKFC